VNDSVKNPFEAKYPKGSIIDTLGGRDATHIFLHDVVKFKPESNETITVQGREKDVEKALVVAGPDDIVLISARTDPSQIAFLSQLGIGPARKNIIRLNEKDPSGKGISYATSLLNSPEKLDEICKIIPPAGPIVINPFIAAPDVFLFAKELETRVGRDVSVAGGSAEFVHNCIQKHWVKERARELGIPLAEGETVELELTGEGNPTCLQNGSKSTPTHFSIAPL